MNSNTRYVGAIGHILIGVIFLMSGLTKITAYGATTAAISSVGLPLAPAGWAVAVLVEVGFGALLIAGYRARAVAAVLAAWCVVTAIFFHSKRVGRPT
jgi:putative oxidoreductase